MVILASLYLDCSAASSRFLIEFVIPIIVPITIFYDENSWIENWPLASSLGVYYKTR